MELKTYFAQDASGNIMPGATVTVYEAGTTTLATGLQDESGSPLANPFTADSSAKVAFYAPDGLYDITVAGNGRTVTIRAQFVSVDGASVLRADLAAPGGSALVGFNWLLAYEQDTVGAAIRHAANGVNVLRWITPSLWTGLQAGAVTADVITAAVASARTAAGNGGTIIIPDGTYYTGTGLDFSGFSGRVLCTGVIKAKPATAIARLVEFSNASDFEWHGGALDFSQTASTADGDARSDQGFYMKDARDGKIHGVDFRNIRIGEVIYIDGTSSVTPSASHGSKRIKVWGCSCVAFAPPSVDIGAAVYIRSDFYTGDGGGAYIAATNGLKQSDYTLDAAVAYQRTTTDIQFSLNRFENFDGFRLFNVARVNCTNQQLRNFYTRGYTLSPSCEDVTITGGIVSGNAAHINVNYACKRCTFSDLIAQGQQAVVGQRHTLRTGFGSEQITFSNIVGFGNDTRHVFVEGAKDVTFIGISLKNWIGGNTTVSVSVAGGGAGNTSSWVTDRIKFIGCHFEANYAIRMDDNAGTATIANGGVLFDQATTLTAPNGFWNGTSAPTKLNYTASGTFTPLIVGSIVAGSHTYTIQNGTYKFSNGLCTYKLHVSISAKDAAMSGSVEIAGLPFSSAAGANTEGAASIAAWSGLTLPANFTQVGAYHQQNRSRVTLARMGSGQSATYVQTGELGNTADLVISGSYWVF